MRKQSRDIALKAIDVLMQGLKNSNRLSGEATTMLSDDLAKIRPVVKQGDEFEVIQTSLPHSYIWKNYSCYAYDSEKAVPISIAQLLCRA